MIFTPISTYPYSREISLHFRKDIIWDIIYVDLEGFRLYSALSNNSGRAVFLKLASFDFVSFFVCLNNLVSHVRVPVSVFYLNMSKKGKKQDVLHYRHWKILLEQSPPFYSQ